LKPKAEIEGEVSNGLEDFLTKGGTSPCPECPTQPNTAAFQRLADKINGKGPYEGSAPVHTKYTWNWYENAQDLMAGDEWFIKDGYTGQPLNEYFRVTKDITDRIFTTPSRCTFSAEAVGNYLNRVVIPSYPLPH
jgi:hypothetical protein